MTAVTCSVADCDRRPVAKGMCDLHRQRIRRNGNTDAPAQFPDTFWSQVERGGDAACWPWTGHLDRDGYGRWGGGRKHRLAHRVAYELLIEPIPAPMVIDHICHGADASCRGGRSCQHRRCCNPAHMDVVTSGVNVQRGRSTAGLALQTGHCKRGHDLAVHGRPFMSSRGYAGRSCRVCIRLLGQESRRVRALVIARAGTACERCRVPVSNAWPGYSLHHRRPRGMGGSLSDSTRSASNLVLLCGSGTTGCHGWIEAHREDAYADGWLLRSHQDPSAERLAYDGQWQILTADGGVRDVVA